MCRGKEKCTELGADPNQWNKKYLLPLPEWSDDQVSIFANAVDVFLIDSKDACLDLIATIRDEELTEWFIEHGQMSGKHRKSVLGVPKPELISEDLRDPIRSPSKYQERVFERDGYRCRYCGARLISQKTMKMFIKKLDSDLFRKGPTNLATHGMIHITWPVADHVKPWNIGGRTNLDNLVTSCGACNYGKDGYTCVELGIEDPLLRPPVVDTWDGLTSKFDEIKKIA